MFYLYPFADCLSSQKFTFSPLPVHMVVSHPVNSQSFFSGVRPSPICNIFSISFSLDESNQFFMSLLLEMKNLYKLYLTCSFPHV